jgi:hypothetical protein
MHLPAAKYIELYKVPVTELLVVAAIITGALTVIGTLPARHFGRLATGRDTERYSPTRASS